MTGAALLEALVSVYPPRAGRLFTPAEEARPSTDTPPSVALVLRLDPADADDTRTCTPDIQTGLPTVLADLLEGFGGYLTPPVGANGGGEGQWPFTVQAGFFDDPAWPEDAPSRGISAALALQDRIRDMASPPGLGWVASVVVALPESQCLDVLNLVAARGTVLTSPEIRDRTGHLFTYRSLGGVAIAGNADPVEVYEVRSDGPARSRRQDRLKARHEPAYIRPESAWAVLEQTVREATNATPRLVGEEGRSGVHRPRWVTLAGPTGIGKSRLLFEFSRGHPALRRTVLLKGACDANSGRPISLFVDILRRFYQGSGHGEGAGFEQRNRWLVRKLCGSDVDTESGADPRRQALNPDPDHPDSGRIIAARFAAACPIVGTLLDIPCDDPRLRLAAEDFAQPLHLAIRDWFAGVALFAYRMVKRPLVLIIDNVDELDAASLHLLWLILSTTPTPLPLVVLAADERGRHPDPTLVPSLQDPAVVELPSLTETQARDYLTASLPECALPEPLANDILRAAQGIPMALEELALALLEERVVDFKQDALTVRAPAMRLAAASPSLSDLLTARLARLPRAVRKVLQICAVLGREIDREWVADLRPVWGEPEFQVDADLALLVDERLMLPRASHPGGTDTRVMSVGSQSTRIHGAMATRYVFTHPFMRQMALSVVPEIRVQDIARRLAAQLATILDQIPGWSNPESVVRLSVAGLEASRAAAELMLLAGDPEGAIPICANGGLQALRWGEFSRAQSLATLGIQAYGAINPELLQQTAYDAEHLDDEGLDELAHGLSTGFPRPDDRHPDAFAACCLIRGRVALAVEGPTAASDWYRRGLAVGAAPPTRGELWMAAAAAARQATDPDMVLDRLERALVAPPESHAAWEFHYLRGQALMQKRAFAQAREEFEHAEALVEKALDGGAAARVAEALGTVRLRQGQAGAAIALLEEAVNQANRMGQIEVECVALVAMARAYWEEKHTELAVDVLAHARALRRYTGDISAEVGTHLLEAQLWRQVGKTSRSLAVLSSAAIIARAGRDTRAEGRALLNLGVSARQAGDLQRAEEALERAVICFDEIGDYGGIATARMDLALVYQLQHQVPQARELLEGSLQAARRAGDRRLEALGLGNLGQLEMIGDTADYDRARDSLREALSISTELGIATPEVGHVLLWLARAETHCRNFDAAQRHLSRLLQMGMDDPAFTVLHERAREFLKRM